MVSIAIDGPSGAGKSTLAKALAKKFGYIYVDTGAMYRTIGLYTIRKGIEPTDKDAVVSALPEIKLEVKYIGDEQRMFLCGEDVSDKIRTNEVSACSSKVSAIPEVRAFLLDLQRNMAKSNNVIMDGRDIGTVILPDATVKFFLNASDESKALRRYRELTERGEKITLEEVKRTMKERDRRDSEREIAPAIPASDAIMIDNSDTLEQTIEKASALIRERIK
ncbi:MAG: (d)CMP kinase [Eubacteriales bacterium]